jgi:NAD(P)-dependent dehydrogenase (short-subunit alcohol dehydrogenase family)
MSSGQKIAVVTGAGSGVGRAVSIELAKRGYAVALLGRREPPLHETIALCEKRAKLLPIPCDVSSEADVNAMALKVRAELGDPTVLVNCAGINVAGRDLARLTPQDFRKVVDVNLTGAFLTVHAFLPAMRTLGEGTIVNVISDAGLFANPVSGAAYTSSKFAMVGLTETINVEERKNGIRACAIFPGEINTPLLNKRPNLPPPEAREKMLQPEDVAAAVIFAIELPHRAIVEKLVLRPRTR